MGDEIIVIGGGLAGLSCAVALTDHGLRVRLFEADIRLGGRASSWSDEHTGDTVDIGPHIFHSEYHNMLGFLQRLGTRQLITWQPRKVLTLATPQPLALRHAPLPPPLSLMPSMLRAPGLRLRDYLSMCPTGWRGMKLGEEDVAELDRISAEAFLRMQGVSEKMIDWWWRFAAMVVTSVPLERCSAASLMRIHAQLSGYRGLHFGFGAVGLAELYSVPGTRVIEAGGGSVHLSTPVRALTGNARADGVVLGDGSRVAASHIVCALPPHQADRLLPQALPAFEPSPYLCCYLWFDRPLRMERFWSHLWSPGRLNYDFYDLTQIRHGWQGRPTVMASNIIYSHRAHHLSDEEILRATVAEIAEFAPETARAKLLHGRVHRIPMAIPCPLSGFEAVRPAPDASIPGVTLAGDWIQTGLPCTMESAVKSGLMAAEHVLAQRGRTVQLAVPSRQYDGLAGLVRRSTRAVRSASP
jgi:squalene-associated FAD-dependent desaturase